MPVIQVSEQADSRLPLYHRLRETLAAMIVSRQWNVGEAIPTEAELSQIHKVSIGTVRKAIDLLIIDGLVERVQGKGTFVRRPTFSSSLFRFFRSPIAGRAPNAAESKILYRSISIPPKSAALALGLESSMQAVHMKRLRYEGGTPMLYEEIWLPLVPFLRVLDLSEERFGPLLYPLYEEEFGVIVTKASEHLTIEKASQVVASELRIGEQEPVVVIERVAFSQPGRGVEWRKSVGPGDRFHYQIEV